MNILELQLITTLILILWFDVFGLHRIILNLFGFESWLDKESLPKWIGWASCYFCTGFWLGIIITLCSLPFISIREAITLIILNTVITRILDNLLGFDSIKSK